MIATLTGNAILGSLVLICLIMCIQGTTKILNNKAYIITFLIMLTIMYTINEGSVFDGVEVESQPKTSADLRVHSRHVEGGGRRDEVASAPPFRVRPYSHLSKLEFYVYFFCHGP